MEFTKLAVIVLVLAAKTCRGEIVVAASDVEKATDRFADDLINIVTSCYKGQTNGVGLLGNLPTKLSRTLSVRHSIPVVVIDNVSNRATYRFTHIKLWRQLSVFIVEASSFETLGSLISQGIKSSIWWNDKASFIIIDPSPGCVDRVNYLFMAFQYDVLNAKVMCSHHESGRRIFNYNPYTSQAPASWRVDVVGRGIYRHPFTLLSREYRADGTVCVDLDFDKTADVGGYPIQFSEWERLQAEQFQTHSSLYAFRATRARMLKTVIRALNATPRVDKELPAEYDMADMRYNFYVRVTNYKPGVDKSAYLINSLPVNIVTHFKGHQSQLNKMLSIIDVESRIGIGVVYLVTLIFFKFFVQLTLGPIVLNLVRLTCSMGLQNLPDNTASRIYLAALLLFVLVMQMIVLCDLSTLLTTPIPLRNVDSIEDLEELAYKKVCTHQNSDTIFEGTSLEKNVMFINNSTACLTHVKNDPSVAYVGTTNGDANDRVRNYNLRVSKQPVEMQYHSFLIRWGWPLEERFNTILARVVEADVVEPWEVKCHPIKDTDFSVDLVLTNLGDFKSIELHEMTFAFVFLGIGLACSSVVFAIELLVTYEYNVWCHVVRR